MTGARIQGTRGRCDVRRALRAGGRGVPRAERGWAGDEKDARAHAVVRTWCWCFSVDLECQGGHALGGAV